MTAGQYRELDKLAEGGMAEIRAGTGPDDRAVVIKRIRIHLLYDDDHRRLFADEGALCARLSHKHIVELLDAGEDDCGPYLVFEYVPGTDLGVVLEQRQAEGRPLEPAQVLAVALPLMRALAYAHNVCADDGASLCVVHRDVSPGNVLLGDNGDVKLVDFGVAASTLRTDATVAGEMKGKFAYMAPEQTRGEAVDARADIFSAGVVLYEMLTAEHLFDAATDADVVHAVRTSAVPDIRAKNPAVPDELAALVGEMLAKDKDARPASAAAVVERLQDIAELYCWDQGHKRHVTRLCLEHPRAVENAEDSGARRRHTQRVLGADAGLTVVPDRGRGVPVWAWAFVLVLVVGVGAALAWPAAVVERPLPPSAVTGQDPPVLTPGPPDLTPPGPTEVTVSTTVLADPVRGSAPAPARPSVRPRPARSRPVKVAQADAAPRPVDKRRPVASGFGEVFISSEPWAEVYVDGAKFGVTPLAGKKLSAGPHTVRLYNPHYKLERTFTVDVGADQAIRKFVDLTK